jgi:polyphosphate kinase
LHHLVAGAVPPAAQADRSHRRLGEAAAAGREARIVLKMNALTDEPLMQALVRAGSTARRST